MPVQPGEIERLIKAAFPTAQVEIRDLAGDGNHYAATVVAEEFRGKNRVQQQRMVNQALADILKGSNAPLHALALETRAPAD
jgi:stress-induced morphogen